uniref:Uncharacterized protein K0031E03.28 n=1 Tax=Oryza sativa subsp. indica TaxID=39946 RepID=C8TEX3_ORYSI|nr:hypothetical protein [Oryza sativa Indica Group]
MSSCVCIIDERKETMASGFSVSPAQALDSHLVELELVPLSRSRQRSRSRSGSSSSPSSW